MNQQRIASTIVATAIVAGALILFNCQAARAAGPELKLEARIPLGAVHGRIDHFAFDSESGRLFLAELGNNSVSIIDVHKLRFVRRIEGRREPQGLAFDHATGTLFVANAGDGSLRLFKVPDFKSVGTIELGDDADNIRTDASSVRMVIGYGGGGLAVVDGGSGKRIADIPLKAHPEGFQIEPSLKRIFVNVPDAREVAVVDQVAGKQIDSWALPPGSGANFPLALDEHEQRVIVGLRNPPTLLVLNNHDGTQIAALDMCGDADDVFADQGRIYVSCGEGFLDIFNSLEGGYVRVQHLSTARGARTSLLVPSLGKLFLAVPAQTSGPAEVWVFTVR
jgi:DNA-binding beta-propeller fold protein YncE